ncbi:MAG: AGE family epimerase/isomerase [Alistipes sp.]|nr:AGE family epimerase/isomerase [Alistipes sp.]
MNKVVTALALLVLSVACAPKDVNEQLTKQAAEEYLTPVHPGGDGRPFWNGFASKFIYAPAFDFQAVEGAESYLYTATCECGKSWSFKADSPQQSLAPIWGSIPQGVNIALKVEGVDSKGVTVGVAGERSFWRDYSFNPPYTGAVRGYREAAILGMLYVHTMPAVQNFVLSSEPDMDYVYFTYPCKIIGAVVQVETLLAKTVPLYRDNALAIARNAAKFLMDSARKPGERLAYFPPTYYKQFMASKFPENQGKTMAMEAASAGEAYLDLYDATGESIYLEQAVGIANTYLTLQNEDGSWHIKYDFATGEPVNDVKAMLHPLLNYLLRLEQQYGKSDYREARLRGEKWMAEHILSSFDMTGQFEDVSVQGLQPYENLTNCTAAPYASYILNRGASADEVTTAYELVRFSEDQFVYWDMPLNESGYKKDSTPCVYEQYKYQMPIDNSTCNVANAMLDIYEQTGDMLMRAKAQALIDNITVTQCVNTGKLLTSWRVRHNVEPSYWINCTYDSVCALLRMEKLAE